MVYKLKHTKSTTHSLVRLETHVILTPSKKKLA